MAQAKKRAVIGRQLGVDIGLDMGRIVCTHGEGKREKQADGDSRLRPVQLNQIEIFISGTSGLGGSAGLNLCVSCVMDPEGKKKYQQRKQGKGRCSFDDVEIIDQEEPKNFKTIVHSGISNECHAQRPGIGS